LELVSQLQDIGLSGYEAKAYLALIASESPLNGYEVAKRSGVPRSTVYETLAKLSARGAAYEVPDGDAITYVALPADALLRRIRARVEQSLDALAIQLDAIAQPPEAPTSYHLEGASVLERAIDLITAARRELYIAGWGDQLVELAPALDVAQDRGVDITVLQFSDPGPIAGRMFKHRFADPDAVRERIGFEFLLLVQDRLHCLIGGAVGTSLWALYSDNPTVVVLASEYIRTDISLQTLVDHVGVPEATAVFDAQSDLRSFERGRGAPGIDRRVARSTVSRLRTQHGA
jgi:sugar-specific transcriptional regulator TrmB